MKKTGFLGVPFMAWYDIMYDIKCKRNLSFAREALKSKSPAAAPAWGAEVVSSNIVGYNKITLSDNLTMVASQFKNVGAGAKDIQEFFSDNSLPGFDMTAFAFQSTLQVWEGTGYTTYYWAADGDGDLLGDSSLNKKWLDENYSVATENMNLGKAFWVETADTDVFVVEAGEVEDGATKVVPVSSGLTMLSNPFPVQTSIQSIVPDATVPGFDMSTFAFQTTLQVWDGTGYNTYYWAADGDGDILGDATLNGKWLDENYAAVSASIDIGKGFWFETTGAGNLTFSK